MPSTARALRRGLLSLTLLGSALGCAQQATAPCPRTAASTQAAAATPAGFGFADPRTFAEPEALSLYDVKWMLLTGDSGALTEIPPTLHSFTLGKWECALGAEQSEDALADARARVNRRRKAVCTHATGITMMTEVGCAYAIPSRPAEGAPRLARRETQIDLGDAPGLTLACEPAPTERLALFQGERQPVGEACLDGTGVVACAAK
jgi:hypothetical protein